MNMEAVAGVVGQIIAKPNRHNQTNHYQITVRFDTDRELTSDEIERLTDQVATQVEEPAPLDIDERRADYITSGIQTEHRHEERLTR